MMHVKKFETTVLILFVVAAIFATGVGYGIYLLVTDMLEMSAAVGALAGGFLWVFLLIVTGIRHTRTALRPVESMYSALEHLSAGPADSAPPDPEAHGLSKAIVSQVIKDVYELSSGQHDAQNKLANAKEFAESLLALQSNAVLVVDRNGQITYANQRAIDLMPQTTESAIGLNLDQAYELEFSAGKSFAEWLSESQVDKIQDRYVWERVRISKTDDQMRYFDMVADYNKNESHGIETIIMLVDKTESYHGDDQQMGFVSLAVHELRSPISLLRGYIEVFEDELGPSLDTDQQAFMQKMSVSASQLSTFVNNILNVARIENDQLKVHLHEDTIYDALETSKEDFVLRAEVRNRKLTYDLGDNIPTVGLDRVAIYEVLSNLIDNAIKYSKDGGEIIVKATQRESRGVSASIQDFGVGIPASSMENLFERFYRSHHSRDLVSGTGLGLFLSKRIIEAHGGTIWVESREGEGSTFGFDLPTFETMKAQGNTETETKDGEDIVRSAHGWIKNHGKVRK